jgi:arginyl-tRNA synthetase
MDFKEKVAEIFTSIEPELSMDDALQLIEIPPNTDMGDYAVPCFKFAKKYRKSPAALANEFVEGIGQAVFGKLHYFCSLRFLKEAFVL